MKNLLVIAVVAATCISSAEGTCDPALAQPCVSDNVNAFLDSVSALDKIDYDGELRFLNYSKGDNNKAFVDNIKGYGDTVKQKMLGKDGYLTWGAGKIQTTLNESMMYASQYMTEFHKNVSTWLESMNATLQEDPQLAFFFSLNLTEKAMFNWTAWWLEQHFLVDFMALNITDRLLEIHQQQKTRMEEEISNFTDKLVVHLNSTISRLQTFNVSSVLSAHNLTTAFQEECDRLLCFLNRLSDSGLYLNITDAMGIQNATDLAGLISELENFKANPDASLDFADVIFGLQGARDVLVNRSRTDLLPEMDNIAEVFQNLTFTLFYPMFIGEKVVAKSFELWMPVVQRVMEQNFTMENFTLLGQRLALHNFLNNKLQIGGYGASMLLSGFDFMGAYTNMSALFDMMPGFMGEYNWTSIGEPFAELNKTYYQANGAFGEYRAYLESLATNLITDGIPAMNISGLGNFGKLTGNLTGLLANFNKSESYDYRFMNIMYAYVPMLVTGYIIGSQRNQSWEEMQKTFMVATMLENLEMGTVEKGLNAYLNPQSGNDTTAALSFGTLKSLMSAAKSNGLDGGLFSDELDPSSLFAGDSFNPFGGMSFAMNFYSRFFGEKMDNSDDNAFYTHFYMRFFGDNNSTGNFTGNFTRNSTDKNNFKRTETLLSTLMIMDGDDTWTYLGKLAVSGVLERMMKLGTEFDSEKNDSAKLLTLATQLFKSEDKEELGVTRTALIAMMSLKGPFEDASTTDPVSKNMFRALTLGNLLSANGPNDSYAERIFGAFSALSFTKNMLSYAKKQMDNNTYNFQDIARNLLAQTLMKHKEKGGNIRENFFDTDNTTSNATEHKSYDLTILTASVMTRLAQDHKEEFGGIIQFNKTHSPLMMLLPFIMQYKMSDLLKDKSSNETSALDMMTYKNAAPMLLFATLFSKEEQMSGVIASGLQKVALSQVFMSKKHEDLVQWFPTLTMAFNMTLTNIQTYMMSNETVLSNASGRFGNYYEDGTNQFNDTFNSALEKVNGGFSYFYNLGLNYTQSVCGADRSTCTKFLNFSNGAKEYSDLFNSFNFSITDLFNFFNMSNDNKDYSSLFGVKQMNLSDLANFTSPQDTSHPMSVMTFSTMLGGLGQLFFTRGGGFDSQNQANGQFCGYGQQNFMGALTGKIWQMMIARSIADDTPGANALEKLGYQNNTGLKNFTGESKEPGKDSPPLQEQCANDAIYTFSTILAGLGRLNVNTSQLQLGSLGTLNLNNNVLNDAGECEVDLLINAASSNISNFLTEKRMMLSWYLTELHKNFTEQQKQQYQAMIAYNEDAKTNLTRRINEVNTSFISEAFKEARMTYSTELREQLESSRINITEALHGEFTTMQFTTIVEFLDQANFSSCMDSEKNETLMNLTSIMDFLTSHEDFNASAAIDKMLSGFEKYEKLNVTEILLNLTAEYRDFNFTAVMIGQYQQMEVYQSMVDIEGSLTNLTMLAQWFIHDNLERFNKLHDNMTQKFEASIARLNLAPSGTADLETLIGQLGQMNASSAAKQDFGKLLVVAGTLDLEGFSQQSLLGGIRAGMFMMNIMGAPKDRPGLATLLKYGGIGDVINQDDQPIKRLQLSSDVYSGMMMASRMLGSLGRLTTNGGLLGAMGQMGAARAVVGKEGLKHMITTTCRMSGQLQNISTCINGTIDTCNATVRDNFQSKIGQLQQAKNDSIVHAMCQAGCEAAIDLSDCVAETVAKTCNMTGNGKTQVADDMCTLMTNMNMCIMKKIWGCDALLNSWELTMKPILKKYASTCGEEIVYGTTTTTTQATTNWDNLGNNGATGLSGQISIFVLLAAASMCFLRN